MSKILTDMILPIFASGISRKNSIFSSQRVDINDGKIVGLLDPAGAAGYVWAEDPSAVLNQKYIAKVDPVTGRFTLKHLPAGSYHLSFTTAGIFIAPATKKIIVAKNQNVFAGTFTFTRSVLSFNIGNASLQTIPASAMYLHNNFRLYSIDDAFTIHLVNITGPGTYYCSANTSNYIKCNGKGCLPIWDSKQKHINASVTIISIDPVARVIHGTFCELPAATSQVSAANNLLLTDGRFTTSY